jgi:hypothetical protein
MEVSRAVVSFAEIPELPTPTFAVNAYNKKKIAMDVPRL